MAKWISIGILGAGIIAAAVCGITVMNGREAVARAEAEKAESEEAAASAAAAKARSEAAAAAAHESAKAKEAKIAEDKRAERKHAAEEAEAAAAKAKEDRVRAEAERAKAADDRARAEAEAEKASAERAAAIAARETARLERDKAKAAADEASLKAQAEADRLARQKLASDGVIAEARLYELKQLDLVSLERELMDFKRELDERERALRPEKTIKDLDSASDAGEDESAGELSLPENDRSLPRSTRTLARAGRLAEESAAAISDATRSNVVSRLERLYVDAVREDRIMDADFYRRELKRMYPDWKYVPRDDAAQNSEKEEK